MLCCRHEIIPFEGYIRSLSSVFTKLVMTRMKSMSLAHTYGSTRFCTQYVLLSRLYTRALYPSKMIVRVVVYILIQTFKASASWLVASSTWSHSLKLVTQCCQNYSDYIRANEKSICSINCYKPTQMSRTRAPLA